MCNYDPVVQADVIDMTAAAYRKLFAQWLDVDSNVPPKGMMYLGDALIEMGVELEAIQLEVADGA